MPVHVIDQDVLPAVTPVHDVVDGARILHSHRARHGAEGANPDGNVNRRNEPQPWRSANLRFDPFPAVNANGEPDGWQNSPTARHGKSCVLAFADGHAERWKWLVLNVDQNLDASATQYGGNTTRDLRRIQNAVFRR